MIMIKVTRNSLSKHTSVFHIRYVLFCQESDKHTENGYSCNGHIPDKKILQNGHSGGKNGYVKQNGHIKNGFTDVRKRKAEVKPETVIEDHCDTSESDEVKVQYVVLKQIPINVIMLLM